MSAILLLLNDFFQVVKVRCCKLFFIDLVRFLPMGQLDAPISRLQNFEFVVCIQCLVQPVLVSIGRN